jgi:hypothetical protein
MSKPVLPLLALPLAMLPIFVLLVGCETSLQSPDYSREYVSMTDAQGRQMLLPEACLGPPQVEAQLHETMKLAPGCANSFNLLHMVEQREDLQHGRTTGPALAAPVGRAAQYYLQGSEAELQRRRREAQEAMGDTGGVQ